MNSNESIKLFVPGRLCLFGEHSDWAGKYRADNPDIIPGQAIVVGIEQGIHALARRAGVFRMCDVTGQSGYNLFESAMEPEMLMRVAQDGGYYSYAAGTAACVREKYPVGGVEITVTQRDLPLKKGLSSSAAICVLVVQAFNQLYGLNLTTLDEMNLAYMGELRTPSRCGRLDQACAFGGRPVNMVFDNDAISVEPIEVGAPVHIVFTDLNAHKDTVHILSALNSAYPFPRDRDDKMLHKLLGEDNRAIVNDALDALRAGDVERLGKLMTEAQRLFDQEAAPLCPQELTAPALHHILQDETVRSLTYGGKGIGSQGDGSVQFVARDEEAQQKLCVYLRSKNMSPFALTLRPRPSVHRAIIPLGGFGTRMYPATRFIKKEFCPVVDTDGLTKPALLVLLEELDAIGIEHICLVINPVDRELYERLLFSSLSEKHYTSLPPYMRRYEDKLRRIVNKVEFAYQHEARGFGHAVLQARSFTRGEPVLLLLGDTLYKSNLDTPCTAQLLEAFSLNGKTTVSLCPIAPEHSASYGVFSGKWVDKRTMCCTDVVEKPDPQYALASLAMETPQGKAVYGAFGAYVLTADIFSRLEYAAQNGILSERGEVELTDAIAWAAQQDCVMGYIPDGRSYDLGNPQAYRRTVSEFGI